MELCGPDRLNVSSSLQLQAAGLAKVESVTLSSEIAGSKLASCKAISVGTLLSRVRPNLGNGVSGVFTAADGVSTDPISLDELVVGLIVHTDANGTTPLPVSLGGPLRVCFPEGVAVQSSVCGTPKPVNLKGMVKLELQSIYEIQQSKVAKELATSAPTIILSLEEQHSSKLLAIAHHHKQLVKSSAVKVSIQGLDARGLTMRVLGAGEEHELLAPFPRPLVDVADVLPMAFEMAEAAFDALGWKFKLQHHYRARLVEMCASPRGVAALVVAVSVAAAGAALARGRKPR